MQLIYPNDPRCWLLIPHVWLLKASFLMVKSHLYIPWVFPNDPQSFSNMNEWIMSVMSCDFPIFSIAITKKYWFPMISPMISIEASRYGSFDTSGAAKAQRPGSGSAVGHFLWKKSLSLWNWWDFSSKWWTGDFFHPNDGETGEKKSPKWWWWLTWS